MSGNRGNGQNGEFADWLRRRREAYARYASVLSDQLEALEDEDIGRVAELTDRREEVTDRLLEQEGEELPGVPDDPPEGTRSLASDVHEHLERCVDLDSEVRERLERLRDSTLEAIRTSREREENARTYIRTDEAEPRNPYDDGGESAEAETSPRSEQRDHIDVRG